MDVMSADFTDGLPVVESKTDADIRGGNGNRLGGVSSPSVSVSSPLPLAALLSAAGRASRLKTRMVARQGMKKGT